MLIGLLGAVFLKGFGEAIGVAVVLVVTYILLNLVVDRGRALADRPAAAPAGRLDERAVRRRTASPLAMIGAALLVFPRLALGLSGFETGVVVMPLVEGDPTTTRSGRAAGSGTPTSC